MKLRILLLSLLLAPACAHRPVAATGIPDSDLRQLESSPVFADDSLVGAVEVGAVQATRLSSGKLRLRIPILNVSGERLEVLVRVAFEDENGYGIEGDVTPDSYVALTVGANWHEVTSLRQQAAKYKIQLRRYK